MMPDRRRVVFALLVAAPLHAALALDAASPAPGYSSLAAITPHNVAALKPVLTFRMGEQGGYAGAIQATGGLVFVQSPFPHTIYALDPARPDNPVRWQVTPNADHMAWGQGTVGTVAGPVLDGDRLYGNTFDGHTIAVDAATGRVAWDVQTAQPSQGETLPTAPLVAEGKVFVGGGGDDFGARGWIEALDAGTGRTLWKRYNTGPD